MMYAARVVMSRKKKMIRRCNVLYFFFKLLDAIKFGDSRGDTTLDLLYNEVHIREYFMVFFR